MEKLKIGMASRILYLRTQPHDTIIKHCYKHEASNVGLVSSASNRQLPFATPAMMLHFLLQVSTNLTRRGERVKFKKLSFQI